MNIIVYITGNNGEHLPLKVNTSDKILKGKKLANQENANWKYNGDVLKNDKTFDDYDIENEDTIISNYKVHGGINIIKNNNFKNKN